MEWHETLSRREDVVVPGPVTAERNSMKMVDDSTLASIRSVLRRSQRCTSTRGKLEALRLLTSTSIARALNFDTRVVHPDLFEPLEADLENDDRDDVREAG